MNFSKINPNSQEGVRIRKEAQCILGLFLSEELLRAFSELGIERQDTYIICFGFYSRTNVCVCSNGEIFSIAID